MDKLGTHLREHREAKGITLEEIGRVSNISLSYLRALEEEQYHILPASTFTIGFLRQYARCIGLDPEDVILRYKMATQQAGRHSRERSMERLGKGGRRSVWVLGGGVVLLVLLWMVLYPVTERTEERVRTIRIPRPSVEEIKKEQLKMELGLLGEVSPDNLSRNGGAAGVAGAAGGRGGEREGVSQTGAVEVILQAIEETWVEITVDQEPRHKKALKPGDRHSCRANERVMLRIGNGTGVRVFYEGRAYENLGKRGDVVQISFPPPGNG